MQKSKPLTKAELAWLKKLQGVLDEQPTTRLAFAATGDRFLYCSTMGDMMKLAS